MTCNNEIMGNDANFLRTAKWPKFDAVAKSFSVVDLFCGCGGISLGFAMAAIDLKLQMKIPLALDFDTTALDCYKLNFPYANTITGDISEMFQADINSPITATELKLKNKVGDLDVLVGGPPCQGHSDLNNFTRRNDPKNRLMVIMARAAFIFKPKAIVIENVVGSLNDSKGVVFSVESYLKSLGYFVDVGILDFHDLGVPQKRRRMILIASLMHPTKIADIQKSFACQERSVGWAILDIADTARSKIVDAVAIPKHETQKRIDYLFDNDLFELPNSQRPPCHRDKAHSYDTVYGRLNFDKPAQTITSGFYCMCMGRYVHPSQRRTLTAREAARLQFFPDFFDFSSVNRRTKLAQMIGNAVPPKGAYVIARTLLNSIMDKS